MDLPNSETDSRSLGWGVLIAATVAALWFYGGIDATDPAYLEWDHVHYRKMAAAAPGFYSGVPQPFAFRILGPLLVGLIPLPTEWAFTLFNAALLVLLLVWLRTHLLQTGIRPHIANITVLAFVMNRYFFGFVAWNPYQVNDTVTMLVFLGLLRDLESDRPIRFALLLLLGSLARETWLLFLPSAALYIFDHPGKVKNLRLWCLAPIPALMGLWAIHENITAEGGLTLSEGWSRHASRLLTPSIILRLLINSWAPFALLPLIFLRSTRTYFAGQRYQILLLVLLILHTAVAIDVERLLAPGFIVVYPLLAYILQAEYSGRGRRRQRILVLFMIIAALAMAHHDVGRWNTPSREVTGFLSASCTALVALLALRQSKP